jgi:lysophospholipase L1-like esterase
VRKNEFFHISRQRHQKNKAIKPSIRNIEHKALMYFILLGLSITLSAFQMYAQPRVKLLKTYTLIKEEENVIENASHLDDFFEKLYQLESTGKNRINIIHIGDSHIQADFLTEVIRRNFQSDFGNAGRGLIVPAKVAGTNEPFNFKTSSRHLWNAKRCVYPYQPLPIGIGGITIQTDEPGAKFDLQMKDPLYDYTFNTLTLFFQKDAHSFNFSIQDSTLQQLALITNKPDSFLNYSRVTLPSFFTKISIEAVQQDEDQRHATLFGLSLENGRHGILYHAIGVNGAKYLHYNAATHFAEQTQVLKPDVFVISLGTNESVEYPYLDKELYQRITKLVQTLSEYNPNVKFILTTPPDAFRKKNKPNPGIEVVREQILQFAVENGLAFWDMYKVNGGKSSATEWRTEGLLRPDGIHFSKEGYAYQGDMLYQAIMKSYRQYVPYRHP